MIDFRVPLEAGIEVILLRKRSLFHHHLTHLASDVFKAWRTNEGEADKEYVRLRVRKWAETVVVFLAGRIPQSETDGFTVYHYLC